MGPTQNPRQTPVNSYTAATGRAMQTALSPSAMPKQAPSTQQAGTQSGFTNSASPFSSNTTTSFSNTPVQPAQSITSTSSSISIPQQPAQNNPAATQLSQPTPAIQPAPQPTTAAPQIQQPAPTAPQIQQPTPNNIQSQQPIATTPQIQQPVASAPVAPDRVNPDNPMSTQATLMFAELRDSLVIMKDGSFRAVIACQSINFDLMSETEREGVEYSYQNFLNSLSFPTQILIRSQKVDIAPYINRLSNMRRENDNMLLGVLMDDYLQFIELLAREANIMDKSFFVVIPYYSSPELEKETEQTKNFFKAMSRNSSAPVTKINRDIYYKAIEELNNRVEAVISGLYQIGIQSVRLNTRELSELYYNFNNPDTAVHQPLVNFTEVATTFVRKGKKDV